MKRFLVSGTYTGGQHAGKSFLLVRGGYVAPDSGRPPIYDTYATEAIARQVAGKYNKRNAWESRSCKQVPPCKYTAVAIEY